MHFKRPFTPNLEQRLSGAHWATVDEVKRTYDAYAALLQEAERDREALLGFVDALGFRLDELPADPAAAREQAANMARSALAAARDEGMGDALVAAGHEDGLVRHR
jgi:hypothetical protein